jgi:hypothetical protein
MAREASGKMNEVRTNNNASEDNSMPTITLVILLRSL